LQKRISGYEMGYCYSEILFAERYEPVENEKAFGFKFWLGKNTGYTLGTRGCTIMNRNDTFGLRTPKVGFFKLSYLKEDTIHKLDLGLSCD
jgi:hypothetical protein